MIPVRFLRANAPYLLAGALLTFCSSFGQTFFISVFAGRIRAEFGLSNGDWGGIYALGTTASAFVMIWAGVLTDHFRARVLGPAVMILLALAALVLATAQTVWMLTVAVFLLRFAGQGMTFHIAVVAMSRWFVATRGRALSIAALGIAAGEAILPVVFVALMDVFPWRVLWAVCALFLVAMVPVLRRLLRLERTPRSVAADAQATGMHDRHWRRPDVLRHWLFWCLVPTILAPSAFSTAFFFLQVHTAEVKGWSHVELVALFPLYTSVAVVGMVFSGVVIDRIGSARLMPVYLLPMAAGFLLLSQAQTIGGAAVAMSLMGLSQGVNSTLPNAFWAEFFGTRHLGAIKSMATAAMVLGSAIGPALTGMLIDRGMDFPQQMPWIALYFLATAVLTGFAVTRARAGLAAAA